jgi:propanol-preferring alcohol dehydrogenase
MRPGARAALRSSRRGVSFALALHAAGRTRVIATDRKLDEVNESIDEVLSGQVPARVVFQF